MEQGPEGALGSVDILGNVQPTFGSVLAKGLGKAGRILHGCWVKPARTDTATEDLLKDACRLSRYSKFLEASKAGMKQPGLNGGSILNRNREQAVLWPLLPLVLERGSMEVSHSLPQHG